MASDALSVAEMELMVNAWVTAIETGAKIRLFTNPHVPNVNTDTTATYDEVSGASWYTAQTPVYFPVALDAAGDVEVNCQDVAFSYGSSTSGSQTIYGYFVTGAVISGTAPLLHARQLPGGAAVLAKSGDQIIVSPGFTISAVNQS